MSLTIDEIVIGDPPQAWADAGFQVDDDGTTRVGQVRLRFVGRDRGKRILDWSLRGLPDDWPAEGDLDGLATRTSTSPLPDPGVHPLGLRLIDHVVVITPDSNRTIGVLEGIGLDARRQRPTDSYGLPMRQTFFKMGEVILELVGPEEPGEGTAGFFGLAFTVDDLDAAATLLAPGLGTIKDAVQPGRRIATMRHKDLGLSVAVALMSPEPAHR